MILIVGGTTEGRIAVQTVEEAGKIYFYSTKKDEQEVALHHGTRITGGMDKKQMFTFCQQHHIRIIIDAAHPFASVLHQNVAEVSGELKIPVIRFERRYPERDLRIHWCNDYDEILQFLRKKKIARWLALTGVQSIAKLIDAWRNNSQAYFRILDRDSSKNIASEYHFTPNQLVYYSDDYASDQKLFKHISPDAILIKESGESGGFSSKVNLALNMGITVIALRRPQLSKDFITVTGPHGLRRKIEKYLPDFFDLHSGLTTGSCATAASVAALLRLSNSKEEIKSVNIILPNDEIIDVDVNSTELITNKSATATIIKDSGDDPDVTNGTSIVATLEILKKEDNDTPFINVVGGVGVGKVTMPGLGIPINAAAINKVPLKMIIKNLHNHLHLVKTDPQREYLQVTISVPHGEELASKTFNPRLGITGGISIVGTSGIIRPFSSTAFIDSIKKSVSVAIATGSNIIVISSGAKSEKFIRQYYPAIPQQAFVHYGNFIGECIKIAEEMRVGQLTLAVMIGKAVKLAEGYMDTHSKMSTMNVDYIRQLAKKCGCDDEVCKKIAHIRMARELWDIIPLPLHEKFADILLGKCYRHSKPLFMSGKLTLLLISEEGKIFSYSSEPA